MTRHRSIGVVTRSIGILAWAAALALAGSAQAADSKVRGRVTGTDGKPVAGARVIIEHGGSGRVYRLETDRKGEYYQRGVLPATYTVRFESDGYVAHIVEDVKVQAGAERELDVTLHSVAERQAEARKQKLGEAYGAGYEAFQKGDFEAALTRAEEAIGKDPTDAKAFDMKAKALVGLRRYAEAIPVLEHELTLEGAAPDAKSVLAAAYYNAGVLASRGDAWDEAIGRWEKAIELGYDEPRVHEVLGRAYLQNQDFGRARTQLETYLAKQPDAEDAAAIRALLSEIQKLEPAR